MSGKTKIVTILFLISALGTTTESGCDSDLAWLEDLAPALDINTEGPPVITSVTPDRTEGIYVGDAVVFTAWVTGGVPPLTYYWALDNETTQWDGTNPFTAVMTSAGVHTVYVDVIDSANPSQISQETGTAQVYVLTAVAEPASKPQVSLSAYTTTIPPNQTLDITASVSGGVPPYTYFWMETGGAVWMEGTSTHVFWPGSAGQSTVYCTVQDANGSEPNEPAYVEITVMEF